ncbi:type VI secretion system baseplate subunit TssE [candidate division KSB1 bacterium]|nr:type VI secretion system baseplate subunit TssE [candidate division KSB1 bacterium]
MENLSLYDLLVGCFPSEYPDALGDPLSTTLSDLENLPEDRKLRLSIAEHLKLLLQTRRGSVLHLPDYGIPDVLQSYIDAGRSVDPFMEQIRSTILKYEPRLGEVKVKKEYFDENNLRLSLRITALIKEASQREILLTEFSTTGWTKVVFERDAT